MRLISTSSPLSAAERARAAYALMVQRKRQAAEARRSRMRTRNVWLAITSCVAVVMLFGLGIYHGLVPTSAHQVLSAREAAANRFQETRTGQVRTFVKGNTCRELEFHNEIGRFVGGSLVPCDDVVPKTPQSTEQSPGNRLNSIRDTFTR